MGSRPSSIDLILRSGDLAASRRMGRRGGFMVRDARKSALLTMRGLAQTHSAARRNMIAGGAAYRYWALKSPVPIRARELEKGSTGLTREPSGLAGINPHLIDSPDFHGLSALSRCGRFLSGRAKRRFYFGGRSSP
jgi:hypothetical protein